MGVARKLIESPRKKFGLAARVEALWQPCLGKWCVNFIIVTFGTLSTGREREKERENGVKAISLIFP